MHLLMVNNYKIKRVQNSNDPMGIELIDGLLTFKVPETFREEEDESLNRKNLLLFVQSLNLSETRQRPEISTSSEEGRSWPIDSYLWIIRDYLENGYYYNRDKKYSKNSKGKIEWKKTMKQMPIVSNGNVIYDKLITSVTLPSNDLIAQIYRLCLRISQDRIGWVFGYSIYVDENTTKSLEELKHTLTNELMSTFDDVKRLRFRHMMNILNSIEEKDISNTQLSYLIQNYYYVFETMVDELLKGVGNEEWKKYNPKGNWIMLNNHHKEARPLEPDTIVKHFNHTYIVDAKMYKFGFTGNLDDLPGSDSIQKQLTYGDHAKDILGDSVRNVFVIPYNKKDYVFNEHNSQSTENENLIYVGFAEGDWRHKESEHDRIYTYLIDFNYVLNNYNTSKTDCVVSLCNDIEKRIAENK